jgi:hypothetical protein
MGLDEMQTHEFIIIVVIGLLIYSIGMYLLTILCSKKNQFPYTIISPLWIITFIISRLKYKI